MFKHICMIFLLFLCNYNRVFCAEAFETDPSQANQAMTIPKDFNKEDLTYSITSVHETFLGRYGSKPIMEGTNAVGNITARGSTVFVNLRGSLGLEFIQTFASSFNSLSLSANTTLEGNAHSGFLTAAKKIQPTIATLLTQYSDENKIPLSDIDLLFGGYSRGSALATFLAPAFRLETDVKSVKCVTYGTLNVVDQVGADSINSVIGKDNFLGFITDLDLSKKYLPATTFYPVGLNFTLEAAKSQRFQSAVRNSKYPYLQPLAALGLGLFGVTCPMWNSHVPDVYLELINAQLAKSTLPT